MKSYYLLLLPYFIIQSCTTNLKTEKIESINDFDIKSFSTMEFTDSTTKQFVRDFIYLPENIHRKVFTVFLDQRQDTMNLTIFRYLYQEIDITGCFGYFKFDGRTILLYSPFSKIISINKDQKFEKEVNALYQEELEYYKNHRHELVMWQLQYSFRDKGHKTTKNYNRIIITYKVSLIPDSIKVDIQWPAD